MATIINADTVTGLKLTSDTSGLIEFQSAGVTKAGVNATGLTGDGSQLTGLPAGGKILQVVQATQATNVETTSASYIATGLTADITVSAGNKVLVLGLLNGVGVNATFTGVKVGLFRASTEITTPSYYAGYNTSSTNHTQIVPLDFLDASPATGSNTYSVKFLKQGSGTARVMVDSAISRIILCEVAA